MVKVGIPRGLFYYYYFPLWRDFFQYLGAEVIISQRTNKKILNHGVSLAVDEACLPVKLFYGHVVDLAGKVDLLFLPRLVSTAEKEYICPKFMGLPDMIKAAHIDLPALIEVDFDLSRGKKAAKKAALTMGNYLTGNVLKIRKAWHLAEFSQRQFELVQHKGMVAPEALELWNAENDYPRPENNMASRPKIGLLGHGYNIYDRYISMDIIQRLRKLGTQVVTAENVPAAVIETEARRLPKRLFWTLGKKQVGAAFHFLKRPDIKGIIHVASFGCGPDSLVGELIERYIRRAKNVPFLFLTIDEQTGEAGIITRLEAFWDMIARRDTLCR